MVDIQSPTAEIRRGKKKKKKKKERNRMKIYMVSLFHRATINYYTICVPYHTSGSAITEGACDMLCQFEILSTAAQMYEKSHLRRLATDE